MSVEPLCYLALDAVEGSAADKQDVLGVYMNILLVGVLAPALWRDIHHRAFKQLKQSLLNALAAHVACYGRIVALARNLVYLVDEHDAALRSLNIIVGHLKQSAQYALNILAHISGLGEHRGIYNGEGDIEQLGYGARHEGLARTGASHHNYIAFLYLYAVVVFRLLKSLVVVIHRHGQTALCVVLTDDILVEIFLYLARLRHLLKFKLSILLLLVFVEQSCRLNYLVSLHGTALAYISVNTRYEQLDVFFATSAKATNFIHPIVVYLYLY